MTTSPNAPSSSLSEDEDDQEINVDSGHEDDGCCQEDDDASSLDAGSCGTGAIITASSPSLLHSTSTAHTNTSTHTTAPLLPFSISRLLGEEDRKVVAAVAGTLETTAGVIRVPAQRIPPPAQVAAAAQATATATGPLPPAPFPWGLVHPAAVIHNSAAAAAAAAAFASHAIKERLSGK